ncbi:hypothetical protein G7Y79_00017g043820 [Physcia stellaris]|nr:hypothetical protein G7Y79_00017g043820 [Physcia stellaris]
MTSKLTTRDSKTSRRAVKEKQKAERRRRKISSGRSTQFEQAMHKAIKGIARNLSLLQQTMRRNRNRRDAKADTPRFLAFASKVDEWLDSRKSGTMGKGFTNVRALEAALFKIRDLRGGKHKTKRGKIADKVIEDEITQTDDVDEWIVDDDELLTSEATTYVDSESTIEEDWSSKSSSETSDGEDSSESF